MLKKIICLTLALLMALAVLTGCSNNDDAINAITEDASRYTTTLNMWVVTEQGTDAAQAAAVNEAINKITKSKYKTQLNIKYLTENEYYTKVEAAFTAHKAAIAAAEEAARNNRGQSSTNSQPTQDETILNEYGVPELKYPTVPDYQVDILFIGSFEKYRSYIEKDWILGLNGVIENSGGQLSYYINDIFLDALKYNGQIYAVSNRRPLGEYTYLMVNEDIMDLYAYSPESFTTFDGSSYSVFSANCRTFLDHIYAEGEITPIYSATGKVDMSLVHYWNFSIGGNGSYVQNFDTFSLFGGVYENAAKRGGGISFGNVLGDSTYINMLANKVYYESSAGYITDTFDPANPCAVCIVTGGAEVREQYEALGYTALITETPRAIDSDIYSSMFAVGKFSNQQSRAMEIIAFLNTNAEVRNLLQYGIENVNYTLETTTRTVGEGDEEHVEEFTYVVPTDENRYFMDPYKTGNMFLLYANSAEDLADVENGKIGIYQWKFEKQKNLDALGHPSLGLYFNTKYTVNAKHIQVINAVSAKFKTNVIDAFTTEAEVKQVYNDLFARNDEYVANYLLNKIGEDVLLGDVAITVDELAAALTYMKTTALDKSKTEQSPNALYNDWMQNSGVNAKEE